MTLLAAQISVWISDPRFQPFLDAKAGDQGEALKLYMWHARMAGSCYETLHHFEVLVRNAIDWQLGAGQPETPLSSTWLQDAAILSPRGLAKVGEATQRMASEGQPLERSRVVASLSFAFWKNLFIGQYRSLSSSVRRFVFEFSERRRPPSCRLAC